MQESYVSRQSVLAWSLWAIVTILAILGLLELALAPDPHQWGFALLLLSGILAPAAAVAHVHVYQIRICALIRNANGLSERHEGMRSVR
jgi:hypothetical protein